MVARPSFSSYCDEEDEGSSRDSDFAVAAMSLRGARSWVNTLETPWVQEPAAVPGCEGKSSL